ncbi:hypothetical protein [Cytobacillus praedii]|uniref:hypothetical protein n=1 Tax=Cytobacillus praedii TaxID=1742358 RepID=UPI002E24A0AC|nr:hypothetical protein [Cytobacillus praedii]
MKGELINIDRKLGFFVKRSDIKTTVDKQVICDFIECLYHKYASSWFDMSPQELGEILEKDKKSAYIGFIMDSILGEKTDVAGEYIYPKLEFHYLSTKEFKSLMASNN